MTETKTLLNKIATFATRLNNERARDIDTAIEVITAWCNSEFRDIVSVAKEIHSRKLDHIFLGMFFSLGEDGKDKFLFDLRLDRAPMLKITICNYTDTDIVANYSLVLDETPYIRRDAGNMEIVTSSQMFAGHDISYRGISLIKLSKILDAYTNRFYYEVTKLLEKKWAYK